MSQAPAAVKTRTAGDPNLRAGTIYAGASMLQKLLTLALLPIYTRILAPSAYGQLSVVLSVATVAMFLFSFGLDTAVLRMWFKLKDDPAARAAWVGSVGMVMGAAPIAGSCVMTLILWAISDMPLGIPIGWMALGIIGAGLGATATFLPQALLRAQERVKSFVTLNLILAGVNTGATLVFMLVFHWGVAGWLAGTFLSYAICLAVAIRLVPWPTISRATFELKSVKEALGYGLPLLPHMVSSWALQLADRIVLVGLITATSLGHYTLASNLTLPVLIIAGGFAQSSMPTFAHFGVGGQSSAALRRLIGHLTSIICATGLAAALLLPVGINDALPSSYYPAAALCGWLALGFTFAGLYLIPMNTISLIAGRTRWVWIITFTAAAVNITLLYLWVPTGGARAAAIATAIAYALLLLGVSAYSVKLVGASLYSAAHIFGTAGVSVALFFGASVIIPDHGAVDTALRVIWVLVSCLILAGIGGFRPPRQLSRALRGAS